MRSVLFVLFAAFLCGCSGGDDGRKEVFAASGTVTLSGKPVSGASISFSPIDGQPVAIGKTDESGVFHLTTYAWEDGAAAGKFNVMITKSVAAPAAASGGHGAMAAGGPPPSHDAKTSRGLGGSKSELNVKYSSRDTSGLKAEVTSSGTNDFTFDLEP